MSLCETVRKLALKGVLLTSTLGMMSCGTTPQKYEAKPAVEQADVLPAAIHYITSNDPDKALEVLAETDSKKPAYDCLKALALLAKWDKNKANLFALNDADTAFNKAINDFVESPGIIELIQEDLKPYFATDHDEKLQKEIIKYIPILPGLKGAMAYIELAQTDYKGTKFWLDKYLKTDHPSDTRKIALQNALKILMNKNEDEYFRHLRASAMPDAQPLERAYYSEQMKKIDKRLAGYRLIQPIFPEDKKFSAEATLNVK